MDQETLAAMLQEEERLAVSYRDTTLADEQEVAVDYYEARPFGDEEEGRSQVVLPDVAEVVDYMTVSVLRTCVSGDRVVEFEANEEEHAEGAQEATEAVSYVFMRQQDGYKVLSDWLQSGLIEKIGVVKTACIEDKKVRKERGTVDMDQLAMLMQSGEQPSALTENGDGTFTVEFRREETVKRYIDLPIPSEEFLFSGRMRDIDDMGYKAHRTRKTISELIEMGFDRDTVESLPDDRAQDLDSRTVSRWNDEQVPSESVLPGMRQVWLLEEYVNIDLNDDGIAELVQVFRVGRTVLQVEEVEENPFAVFCPFPRAHRMVGNGLADKVMDLQRIRSVIMRQTLDGIYLTNNPRMWLPNECQDENTIDDILTVRPGGLVRGKGAGGKPEPLYEPFDVQRGMSMLELLVGERESRTGITRLNQGLDADALNKTATGTALMQAQGQQMEEYIARNFAEAMARLFLKKYRLMKAHGAPLMKAHGAPLKVKVEGGWKAVNPSEWSDDVDVSIRVGLGSGRKDQRLGYRAQLLALQERGLQAGLCTPKHVWKNVSGLIRDAALGEPGDFWQDPEAPDYQPPQPQPDPKAKELEMKGAQAQQDAMLKAQIEGAKLQQKADEAAIKANVDLERLDRETMLKREEMALEAVSGERIRNDRPGGSLDA